MEQLSKRRRTSSAQDKLSETNIEQAGEVPDDSKQAEVQTDIIKSNTLSQKCEEDGGATQQSSILEPTQEVDSALVRLDELTENRLRRAEFPLCAEKRG